MLEKQGIISNILPKSGQNVCYRRPTSTKTRIETFRLCRYQVELNYRRPTSTKTRIETKKKGIGSKKRYIIADRHPLKQGLKQANQNIIQKATMIADRHPLKQGLKQDMSAKSIDDVFIADRHPLKQGLKL